jgi:hypothetical protein
MVVTAQTIAAVMRRAYRNSVRQLNTIRPFDGIWLNGTSCNGVLASGGRGGFQWHGINDGTSTYLVSQ